MSRYGRNGLQDWVLRAFGLGLLWPGAAAMRDLCEMVRIAPHRPASALEMSVAAVGFISLSLGAALGALGSHVFDQVEVSERWRPRSGATVG